MCLTKCLKCHWSLRSLFNVKKQKLVHLLSCQMTAKNAPKKKFMMESSPQTTRVGQCRAKTCCKCTAGRAVGFAKVSILAKNSVQPGLDMKPKSVGFKKAKWSCSRGDISQPERRAIKCGPAPLPTCRYFRQAVQCLDSVGISHPAQGWHFLASSSV